jgi:hypothetical protein
VPSVVFAEDGAGLRACPPGVFPGARVFLASGLDNQGRAAISVDP